MIKKKFWVTFIVTILCVGLTLAMAVDSSPAATAEQPHAKVQINLLSSMLGTPNYVMSLALGEIINKHHPWLRVSNMETMGFIDNIKRLVTTPDMKKDTLFVSEGNCPWLASRAAGPFQKYKYDTWKIVGVISNVSVALVTFDPKIKTWRDMKGKRVCPGPVASMLYVYFELLGDAGWGRDMLKTMKLQPMPLGPAKDAILDRLIDVTIMPMASLGPDYVPSPLMVEMTTVHPTYGIDWGEEAVRESSKRHNLPLFTTVAVPLGAYGLSNKEPHASPRATCFWVADAAMPDEVVYEVTKTLYENVERFAEYHFVGKYMTKETVTQLPVEERYWHAGALKFYKERGIKIGK